MVFMVRFVVKAGWRTERVITWEWEQDFFLGSALWSERVKNICIYKGF